MASLTPEQWLPNAINSVIGTGTSILGSVVNNRMQRNLMQQQNKYNLEQWNRMNEYNSPLAQRLRLEAAGLNPNLMYGTPSAATSGNATTYSESATPALSSFSEAAQFAYPLPTYNEQMQAESAKQGIDNAKFNLKKANTDAANQIIDQNNVLLQRLTDEEKTIKQTTENSASTKAYKKVTSALSKRVSDKYLTEDSGTISTQDTNSKSKSHGVGGNVDASGKILGVGASASVNTDHTWQSGSQHLESALMAARSAHDTEAVNELSNALDEYQEDADYWTSHLEYGERKNTHNLVAYYQSVAKPLSHDAVSYFIKGGYMHVENGKWCMNDELVKDSSMWIFMNRLVKYANKHKMYHFKQPTNY